MAIVAAILRLLVVVVRHVEPEIWASFEFYAVSLISLLGIMINEKHRDRSALIGL